MKERPILFSSPRVRAILEGRETQTRRAVKHLGLRDLSYIVNAGDGWWGDERGGCQALCPYGVPGDRLWVRETWREWSDAAWHYAADGTVMPKQRDRDLATFLAQRAPFTWESYSWRPSIHMPRRASRITLEIESVRVDRLQDISEEDARAEGCDNDPDIVNGDREGVLYNPRTMFEMLWESINGAGSWAANPWVWVVQFHRVEQ